MNNDMLISKDNFQGMDMGMVSGTEAGTDTNTDRTTYKKIRALKVLSCRKF
jgi:hypothetical protein